MPDDLESDEQALALRVSDALPDERVERQAHRDALEQASLAAQEQDAGQERSRRLARAPFEVAASSPSVAAQHSSAADSSPDAACPKARREETASTGSQRERLRAEQAALCALDEQPRQLRSYALGLTLRL